MTNSITQSKINYLGERHKNEAKYQIFEEDLYQRLRKDYVLTTRDRQASRKSKAYLYGKL